MVATRSASPKEEPMDEIDDVEVDVAVSKKGLPPSQSSFERKFIISKKGSIGGSQLYVIRHPKLTTAVLYRISKDHCDEVISCGEEQRSWFYGESIVSDGSLKLCVPVHPLFLVLPYLLKKKERFEVLEEILCDEVHPSIARLIGNEQMKRNMKDVTDCKEFDEECLYRYNEEKTMKWLEVRFERLQKALLSHAGLHQGISGDKEVLDRHTFAILCDTLPLEMIPLVKTHLSITDAPVETERIDQSYKRKADDLDEEYGMEKPVAKKAPRESVVKKQLKVASKGTKSISSFFGKK